MVQATVRSGYEKLLYLGTCGFCTHFLMTSMTRLEEEDEGWLRPG